MAALNYATQYQRTLTAAYPYVLKFGKLFTTPNNELYKPVDAKTIKIPKITTSGRFNASRDTITPFARNANNDWETKELTNYREWNTLIDNVDVIETNLVMTMANVTKTFNEFQKFPEKDRYLVSKIYADWVANGATADTTALTAANILSKIDAYMEACDEARVPESGRLLYVTPPVNTLIKSAVALQRYLTTSDKALGRTISRIDELEIIRVPSDLMKTVFDFTSGSVAGTGAAQINMFLVHPTSILTPEIYSAAGFQEPSVLTKFKWVYAEVACEDAFILNDRAGAINFNITNPPSQG
jgi:hypothetical protein